MTGVYVLSGTFSRQSLPTGPLGHFRLRENWIAHCGRGYSSRSPYAGDCSTPTLQANLWTCYQGRLVSGG